MTVNRFLLSILPAAIMLVAMFATSGFENRLAGFGSSAQAKLLLGRAGLALPFITAAAIGVITLFAANGSANIKTVALSVLAGNGAVMVIAVAREVIRLAGISSSVPTGQSVLAYTDPATMAGASATLLIGVFAVRVAIKGNAAFTQGRPTRVSGKRAVHGDAAWMSMLEAGKLFSNAGGIVVGERYRVDRASVAAMAFRTDRTQSWGSGGTSPRLCFDGSLGS